MGGPRPHVEVAAIILDGQERILIGKKLRRGGPGQYELPGGNLAFGEDLFACAKRKALEETGLPVHAKRIIAYSNDIQQDEEKHEVTLYMLCHRDDKAQQQQPEPKQAAKFEAWEWKSWQEIKTMSEADLFEQTRNLVRSEPDLDTKF